MGSLSIPLIKLSYQNFFKTKASFGLLKFLHLAAFVLNVLRCPLRAV